MENEIEKIIRHNVDIHDEDCKSGYIIGAFYIHELADKIVNSWKETRLKEISEEKKRLQKQIYNCKKKAKIKEPKMLSKKQCDRLVKKYRPKKRKRI